MSKDRVINHEQVRTEIREYYREADLWIPSDPSWRIYRVQSIDEDGYLNFFRLRDRITSTEKLREHLIKHTPLNVYFTVSCFLNPSKTSYKTYKKDYDGRHHIDKNHFLYSDVVVDCDHMDREEVVSIYKYIQRKYEAEDFYIVFSGGGFHVNAEKLYTNKQVTNPIEREKKFEQFLQEFAADLINQGFEFDYMYHGENHEKINSPTTDTRRVRKLPNTVTKYGNKAELVEPSKIHGFEPEQVITEPNLSTSTESLVQFRDRVKALCQ